MRFTARNTNRKSTLPGQRGCRSLIPVLAFLCLSAPVARAQDVAVKSYLDRNPVAVGEQFTLLVEISGNQANSAEPEDPNLGGFATPLGSGTSSQIQLINGQMSVSRTISYYFQALREGQFEIPAIKVRTPDGILTTESVSLHIEATPTAPARSRPRPGNSPDASSVTAEELFVEASADKLRVYQGQAVVVTYDILTLVSVGSYSLVDLPSTQGFWVEDYPIDRPQTRSEVVDGRRYTVATIKQMALIPTSSGKKTIEPLVVECEVRLRRRGDFFDDLFGDRLRNTQRTRIASRPLEIEVLPLPAKGRPAGYSGAVGHFEIEAGFDKEEVEENQAVTLTVKVRGEGNITSISDPEVDFPAGFEIYPPESKTQTWRRSHGIEGDKTYEYVLVPRISGSFEIPAIELAYFDPDAESYKVARTAPLLLEVSPSEAAPRSVDSSISKREVELLSEDIRFLKSTASLRRRSESLIRPLPLAISLFAPLLLLGVAILYTRHREKLASDEGYARQRRSRKLAASRLSSARKLLEKGSQGEFYAEVERALTGFAGDRLNLPEAGIISSQLLARLRERGVTESAATEYIECIRQCQQKRFAPVADSREERTSSLGRAETAIVELARGLETAGRSGGKR